MNLKNYQKKEIRLKGIVSSYYEYLKNDIISILTNSIVDLVINNNIEIIKEKISKDIDTFYNTIFEILDDEKFNLSGVIKEENIISLNNIFNYFKNNLSDMRNNLENKLIITNLKDDNKDIILKIYDNKSIEYKKEMNYEEFCKNVNDLIYDNLSHNSKEIINNMFNIMFNIYVINSLRDGIKEQFQKIQSLIVKEIYDNLFED